MPSQEPGNRCPRCLQPVPARVRRCPQCNEKVARPERNLMLLAGIVGAILLIGAIVLGLYLIPNETDGTAPAEQKSAPAQQSKPPLN